MRLIDSYRLTRAIAGGFALSLAFCSGAAHAQDKRAGQNLRDENNRHRPSTTARIYSPRISPPRSSANSGGRIKGEVYPASQLGSIPRQIEGVQFGAIQVAVVPPEFFVGVDERFEVMAAPGLVNSLEHGQRLAADPAVLKLMLGLGANKGLHGAGMFMVQPDSLASKVANAKLGGFQGQEDPHIRVRLPIRSAQAVRRDAGRDDPG